MHPPPRLPLQRPPQGARPSSCNPTPPFAVPPTPGRSAPPPTPAPRHPTRAGPTRASRPAPIKHWHLACSTATRAPAGGARRPAAPLCIATTAGRGTPPRRRLVPCPTTAHTVASRPHRQPRPVPLCRPLWAAPSPPAARVEGRAPPARTRRRQSGWVPPPFIPPPPACRAAPRPAADLHHGRVGPPRRLPAAAAAARPQPRRAPPLPHTAVTY
jgi:hypothetical protein